MDGSPSGVEVERYFATVSDGLLPLPPHERARVLAGLRTLLHVMSAEHAGRGIAALLAELGDPAEVAAGARAAYFAAHSAPVAATAGTAAPDGWVLVVALLTALFWPVGVALAAVSGRWHAKALAAAAAASLLGWGAFALLFRPGAGLAGTSVHHAWLSALGTVCNGAGLVMALFGVPAAAAFHLSQAVRQPERHPRELVAALVALGALVLVGRLALRLG